MQIEYEAENQHDDSSDYGSDFSPEEQHLLDELLERVATTTIPAEQSQPQTRLSTPPFQQPLTQLTELKPLRDPPLVTDIEDNELPRSARIPKVLGREVWSPARRRQQQRQQQQQQQQQHQHAVPPELLSSLSKKMPEHELLPISVERPTSTEGRYRDLERQQAREKVWTAHGTSTTTTTTTTPQTANNDSTEKTPLERFRKPPNKALSVSDLIAPAWCELQYWYTLTKFGRKRRTPAMKQGTAMHKVLEEEVHVTVPVEITTKEDGWALRIWNIIQGLRTLREYGITRELEIWGLIEGEIVTGIIDQLSYVCPDPELEAAAERFYADADAARAALPEYQMSITDYLLSPSQGGRRLDELGWSQAVEPAEQQQQQRQQQQKPEEDEGTSSYVGIPRIYITDIKTRASRSVPTVSSTSFRPTHLQLQLYYHMLNRLVTSDDVTIDTIAQRYDLDTERVFTNSFLAEVGGLNDHYFDAPSSQESDPDYVPDASQDSMTILLSHNNLSSLWKLMKRQLRYTFLPTKGSQNVAPSVPAHSQPKFLESYPTVLSPVLTAKYISSAQSEDGVPTELGSRSFLFDPSDLTSYSADQLSWWRGDRAPRGVEVTDAWKCRICEFRDECDWRKSKERELAARRRRLQKTGMDVLGAS